MGFHSHWSCFTLRTMPKVNLLNGFPFWLELFHPSFCDQSEPFKWVSILTGVVLPLVLWPKRTFKMGFYPHWGCFYPSFCDKRQPLKWVSILTGVVLLFVLWPKRTFEMGIHPHWSCFTLRSVTKENLWNVLLFVLWPKWTFEMGFHSHWSCFTLRSVTKVNLWNGFPFSLELFYPSFCEPLKWVSIPHWSCFTLRSVTKVNLCDGFPFSLELFYSSFCDQREPLKWVSILTGVVLPFVLWPKRTFEMGFHSHWSCFTLRTGVVSILLELFYPSFCDQREPLKWVSILTGVVLPFVLWPKWTFEMGFHSHWSCFTLRSVTKVNLWNGFPSSLELFYPSFCDQSFHPHWNLWNGFPSSLELFYPSFCDQSEPLKWVSILTGVVLPFVLWPKWTFEMGFHSLPFVLWLELFYWSCFTLRSVTKVNLWNGFPSSLELFYFVLWPKGTFEMGFHSHWSCFTFELWPKWTFEMGFHSDWSCFTLRSVTKENLWNGFPFSLELFYPSFCDQREPLKWVSILTGVGSVTKVNLWNGFPF